MEYISNLLKKIKDKKCPACGKPFFGCAINVDNSNSTSIHPGAVNIEISSYPLSCGKCPECAEKCFVGNIEHQDQSDLNYDLLLNHVKKNLKIPCQKKTILEYYNLEINKNHVFSDEEIKRFIDSMMESVDCCPYLDKFYFLPEWDTEYKGQAYEPQPWDVPTDYLGGKLVNIFDLIKNEIQED